MTESQPTILTPLFEDMYRSEYPGLIAVATALSGAGVKTWFKTRW